MQGRVTRVILCFYIGLVTQKMSDVRRRKLDATGDGLVKCEGTLRTSSSSAKPIELLPKICRRLGPVHRVEEAQERLSSFLTAGASGMWVIAISAALDLGISVRRPGVMYHRLNSSNDVGKGVVYAYEAYEAK